ncbi:DeoR/GlpR family DNA-binding transcription regulator [Polycladidibacter hongkongensis]|uniref:DeoR/GlpR family DNA-binding transcription regulator n=1 Tax=Polycladidibacter hongkongensis TaxID=1647556 RepID=UPI0008328FF1|nr:DeoR/GlpR family DNA-binding transcription regulator [Pseudovibrio hongkongensis]
MVDRRLYTSGSLAEQILQLLRAQRSLHINKLHALLQVPARELTAELKVLAAAGLVCLRGLNVICIDVLPEPALSVRMQLHSGEKTAIGEAAAELVGESRRVLVEGGSTSVYFCRALQAKKNLEVISCSPLSLKPLSARGSLKLRVTGGEVCAHNSNLVGPRVIEAFENADADLGVLSPAVMDPRYGPAYYEEEDALIARAICRGSRRVIVLADQSKLGQRSNYSGLAEGQHVEAMVSDMRPQDLAVFGDVLAQMGHPEVVFVKPVTRVDDELVLLDV